MTHADSQWELVRSDKDNDISVYYRSLPSGNIEFKGITHTTSSLSGIIALFLDFENMPQWLYRTEQVTLLERDQVNELYIYTIHTMPFPFRNRDSINFVQLTQVPSTKKVIIDLKNTPHYIQPYDDLVRVKVAVSQWQLMPRDDGTVQVTFTGYGEPGGSISASSYRLSLFQWLVKQFLWQVPYKTLLGLKQFVAQEKYQNRKLDFILEVDK
ncbi:MAG: hypothetical protein AMJ53_05950 [Gammaproteobacteria bacterium SG8_11]|nr:MAG: hypothetical protein AMJ53_05950 [Gammaproteobacteria bacterium SG8_11]